LPQGREYDVPEKGERQGRSHDIAVADSGEWHRQVVGIGQCDEGQPEIGHLEV
jgi:hypothetical protein